MAEEQSQAPRVQEAERYYSEHVQLDTAITGSPLKALQESLNKGARQSWKLVGVVQDPTSPGGIFLVWDTQGFFSG
ncbi:MAG: hypothetical protein M3272_03110 [Actinomycetota bacterium]|nr:hypothetical protein [Actinomycetota bacterium]